MRPGKRLLTLAVMVGLGAVMLWAAETRMELTKKLWPRARITAALKQVEKLKSAGLMSDKHYQRKKTMLEARLRGTFQPTMLSLTNPPLNFIQNAGFEEINRNSARNRSRWLWWGGWSWGGDYENKWEDRPEHVRSGKHSARIQCLGRRGRIGLMTPKLPLVPGTNEYEFTIWAKGTGNNQLFINFEAGARGTFRGKVGPDWEMVTVKGNIQPNADGYTLYVYVTGEGTIWLDDAKMVPVGGKLED